MIIPMPSTPAGPKWSRRVWCAGRLSRADRPARRFDLPDPDFIKIDAEGHELRILQGATAVLRRARPHIILENWLERRDLPATIAPLKLLEREGYRLFVPCWQAPGTRRSLA